MNLFRLILFSFVPCCSIADQRFTLDNCRMAIEIEKARAAYIRSIPQDYVRRRELREGLERLNLIDKNCSIILKFRDNLLKKEKK